MFTWTDQYGTPVTYTPTPEDIRPILGTDVAHLNVWVAAAQAANEADFCPEYDRMARIIGAPTRDDLASAGLLDSEFTVRGTRTVTVTVTIPFETTYSAARPGDVRREFSADDLGDVDGYEVREAIYRDFAVDSDEVEIDEVERA
jgi:hypothetical protein